MNLDDLFAQFVKERRFLDNVTDKTIQWYWQSWKAYKRTVGTETIDKLVLIEFVVKLRESGISVTSVNVYTRAINSFLSWLYEGRHTADHLKIKQIKEDKKIIQTLSDQQIKALLSWKPKSFYQWRLYAIVCLVLDTGVRIQEALTLERSNLDFENLLITVMGKGKKERIVPMSFELRKVLWKFSKMHDFDRLFTTRRGGKIEYHNTLDDFKSLCEKLSITGVRCSFHTLRHTFAYKYAQSFARMTGSAENGILHLQKQLGHTSLTMVRRYVELQPEDLKAAHTRISILNRLM